MAFVSSRALGKLVPTVLRTNLVRYSRNNVLSTRFGTQTASFSSRSIWQLSDHKHSRKNSCNGCNGICCSRGMSGMAADNDMVKFLTDEIQAEKEESAALPEIKGFQVEKMDGAEICLIRKGNGETVRVRANVNNSMDDDSLAQEPQEGQEGPAPDMVSRPPLAIEITKDDSDQMLCINCEFPRSEDMTDESEYVDVIELREVALRKKGEKEWRDETYCVAGAVCDQTMYDLLLSMLEERGVDGAFCDAVVTFATQYEHDQYVDFLEKLQAFIQK